MSLESLRITLRLHRFELIAFVVVLGGLTIALVVASGIVAGMWPGDACPLSPDGLESPSCEVARREYYDAQQRVAGLLVAPTMLATFGIGLFLGVPIVARELERGTTRLAWWLAPRRRQWYLARLLPIAAVVAGLLLTVGFATDAWAAASAPDDDIANSFMGYGARGVLLAARAFLVFGVAVLTGAVLGRALPAVIVAIVLATAALIGVTILHDDLLRGEAVAVSYDEQTGFGPSAGDRWFDTRFQLPDGTLVGYEYFGDQGPYDEAGNLRYPQLVLVIPGSRYGEVAARESLVLVGGTLLALVITGVIVGRRRPG